MNKKITYLIYFLAVIAVLVFCFFFVGTAKNTGETTWGVDFSQMQAESLELDWKAVYLSVIKDLGVKNIKLHTQWDWIEGKKNNFYFEDIDWQLEQVAKNNVNIIYVVGVKSGRWPECHIPGWVDPLSIEDKKKEALEYIKETILRYKDNDAIVNWQIENEPFFKFGQCPAWYYDGGDFLKKEIELVKQLDPARKIIVSDSGEGSMWFGVAKTGDIIGTTIYRSAWVHITNSLGFHFNYFFPPVFYARKAMLIHTFFDKEVICIELQAEPWVSTPFNNVPLPEQGKTMNPEIFKSTIEYAKGTGFDTFYFWGVEWWYWMKNTHGQPEIWNIAEDLFANK